MSLMIRDNSKAIVQFSKALEIGYELLRTFAKYYITNV